MNMRSILATVAALGFGLALSHSAQAGPTTVNFNPTGGVSTGFKTIDTINILPGNSLAVDGNAATSTGSTTPFQVFFQASVNNAFLGTTQQFNIAGATYQVTVVAGFNEKVLGVLPTSSTSATASFGFAPGGLNFLRFFANPVAKTANDLAGTGFTDGTLILDATVSGTNFSSTFSSLFGQSNIQNLDNDANGNQHPGIFSVTGSGSVDLQADVLAVNPAFFQAVNPGETINLVFNSSKLVTPFQGVEASNSFADIGGTVPVIGTVNGLPLGLVVTQGSGGKDFQFETQATAQFGVAVAAVVPEPSSLILLGLSTLSVGLASRFRKLRNSKS